jgi:hypothetical protein
LLVLCPSVSIYVDYLLLANSEIKRLLELLRGSVKVNALGALHLELGSLGISGSREERLVF